MKSINNIPDTKNMIAFKILEELITQNNNVAKPLIIGITGAGGAGKTTFANNIVKFYGSDTCLTIDLDDYLISRKERGKLGLTGYNPQANKLMLARDNIEELLLWKDIKKPRYDHKTGNIIKHEIIRPKPLIVIEGVTTLYDELRDLNKISFYLDAPETTQIQSRIKRDVETRGYTLHEALTLIESVRPDYKRYIEPTKRFATVILDVDLDYVMHLVDKKI
jgi:phosphoribulokinase